MAQASATDDNQAMGSPTRPVWRRLHLVVVAMLGLVLAIVANVSAAPQAAPATPPPASAATPVISAPRVDVTAERTSLRLQASAPVVINAFALSAPYRVVIDMAEARFDLASLGREPHGLIRAWRAGVFATGRSRIVLDTSGPVRIASARVQPTADGMAEIAIDLQPASIAEFEAAERARQQATAALAATAPAPASAGQAGKTDRESQRSQSGPHKMIVVLDPGHGGLDAGTVSPHTGMPEKQVVLEFAKLLEKKLIDSGHYEVYLTRTTDTFVPLGDRVKFARAHHADLLVSIHADAELDRSVRGSTIFTLSDKASDATAAALAIKENQSDALAGIVSDDKSDDVADILIDLIKRETRTFSYTVAETLVEAMSRSGHMVKLQPHRSASLRVLKAYDFPSVLIELAFLSNKDDEAELVSPKWRDQTANAIVGAVDRFFATREGRVAP